MQALGEGFGEAVGQRLDHDRRIVVVRALEALGDLVLADAGGDDEGADVVGDAALARRDEIGERHIGAPFAPRELLAQRVQHRDRLARAPRRRRRRMSSPTALAGQKPTTALARNQFSRDDAVEHRLRVVEQLRAAGAVLCVVEDRGKLALQLPGLEERRPVDIATQLGDR